MALPLLLGVVGGWVGGWVSFDSDRTCGHIFYLVVVGPMC
jgi:hypothetical protein